MRNRPLEYALAITDRRGDQTVSPLRARGLDP
jgi:hypothetical protein